MESPTDDKLRGTGYWVGLAEGRKQGMREAESIVRLHGQKYGSGAKSKLIYGLANLIEIEI